jgi:glycosyltransferase involved in cell wall biosynthesis
VVDSPLVSVITPSLNQAEYLEDAILAQDYPNLEYIIVDGGSTDGSLEIIRRHAGRISHWVSEPDHGQSDAINKGFRMARGEIIAWLNSDDMYFPGAVTKAVARFLEIPDLVCFYGDAVFIGRQGNFHRYFTEAESFNAYRLLNCSDFIMQPTTFFRRQAFLDAGALDPGLNFTMDFDLWCRFARRGDRFHYEQELIAANREYSGTKTLRGRRKRLRELVRVLGRYRSSWWPHAFFSYLRANVLSDLATSASRSAGLLRPLVTYGLGALCFRNYLHSRFHTQPMQGVIPHSSWLLQEARLCVPVYRPVSHLALRLEYPFIQLPGPAQSVEIFVNGARAASFDFAGDAYTQDVLLRCGEIITRDKFADVRLQFHRTGRKARRWGRLAARNLGFTFIYE